MLIAGVDEAGTGAAAGPFTVGIAVFDTDEPPFPGLADSKKISKAKRDELRWLIMGQAASYVVDWVKVKIMSKMNIHNAKLASMRYAVWKANSQIVGRDIDLVIVDGSFEIPGLKLKQQAITKADDKHWQVSAASILAKTERDAFMMQIHEDFPEYGWLGNKGYGTTEHMEAISKYGITEYHRYETFKNVKKAYQIYEENQNVKK